MRVITREPGSVSSLRPCRGIGTDISSILLTSDCLPLRCYWQHRCPGHGQPPRFLRCPVKHLPFGPVRTPSL